MRHLFAAIAVIVALIGGSLAAEELPKFEEWKEFSPDDTSFKIVFPKKPETQKEEQPTYKIEMFNTNYNGILLMVGISSFPKEQVDVSTDDAIKLLLDRFQKSAYGQADGKLHSSKDIVWQKKFPGRDISAEVAFDKDVKNIHARLIFANGKMYHLIATGNKEIVESPEIGKFLDSLEIK